MRTDRPGGRVRNGGKDSLENYDEALRGASARRRGLLPGVVICMFNERRIESGLEWPARAGRLRISSAPQDSSSTLPPMAAVLTVSVRSVAKRSR